MKARPKWEDDLESLCMSETLAERLIGYAFVAAWGVLAVASVGLYVWMVT